MVTISSPTGFSRSITSEIRGSILGNDALDAKTKGFILAALMCVGNQSHEKEYIPEFQHWKVGSAKTFGKGGLGLNCWTALTHVSTIKIIDNSNEDKDVSIRVTPKPFWELPIIPWKN